MDPKLEERLAAIEHMVNENNSMLKKIQRRARAAAVMKGLYWLFILGLGITALSMIKPYFEQLKRAYGLSDSESLSRYQELLDSTR